MLVWLTPRRESENGYESTFAVNHLGHFLLTNLLLDRLKVAPSARIVNVGALLYKLHKEYKFDEIKLIAKTLPDSVVSPTGLTFKASLPMYYSPWGYISVLRAPTWQWMCFIQGSLKQSLQETYCQKFQLLLGWVSIQWFRRTLLYKSVFVPSLILTDAACAIASS